ncbi:helix-turn-helix transcriptional regulator [Pseudalkalibacillus caeni]|uniref:Helix-turn-helix domain-containing protein n=1 Tax=Exobacillus caeni TaxID=2574798 RepID=A0A5R9FB25_9BACL|nr:helix-turn-helix domain-containing protein [Pseudalkalibacillus caeni]TLS36825.1 helix-turn-helix domain-containing protein [Pseudalkalibacillus caeni]
MTQDDVVKLISEKLKLIRTEDGLTQIKMAELLGVSKKTLVQIEKGRTKASWTLTVAVCALFRDSEVLRNALGEDPVDMIETLAHESIEKPKEKTMGGKVWWVEVEKHGCFRLQRNMISQHYRILDEDDYRWYSTFDQDMAFNKFHSLTKR